MKDEIRSFPQDRPAVYEIKLEGQFDDHMRNWFEDMEITEEMEGSKQIIRLTGLVTDQAALQGVLSRIYTLGFVVVSVSRGESSPE